MKRHLRALAIIMVCLLSAAWLIPARETQANNTRADGRRATVAANNSAGFAITPSGDLYAWGNNAHGRLGDGTTEHRTRPVRVLSNVSMVSTNRNNTAVVRTDGSLWAWGANWWGQTGLARRDEGITYEPYPVWIMDHVRTVAVGNGHMMAIRTDHSLWAWGSRGLDGRYFGDGIIPDRLVLGSHVEPYPVLIMENVLAVSISDSTTMVITRYGELYGWGTNFRGRLGDGTTEDRLEPVRIMDNIIAVSAGNTNTLAICQDGLLWAWGGNGAGQLGIGNLADQHSPVQVPGIYNVVSAVAAGESSFALTSDNNLWAWGMQGRFQHGGGDGIPRNSNVPRITQQNIVAIAAATTGGTNVAAIRADGGLYTWGGSMYGSIGNGEMGNIIASQRTPVRIIDRVMLPPLYPRVVVGDLPLPRAGATPTPTPTPSTPAPSTPAPTTTQPPTITTETAAILSSASPWAHDSIMQALEMGLIPQNLQNNFTANITRAEFAALAVALYETEMGYIIRRQMVLNDTTDINMRKMASLDVIWADAYRNANPYGLVSRQWGAVMISRLANAMGNSLPSADPTFADNAQITGWMQEFVGQMQASGIMGSVGNNQFDPTAQLTREQIIIIMMRLLNAL